VAALELNISCPNIKEGGITFGCSLHGTADVVGAVRAATRLPVIPKLTPNVTDISVDRQGRRRRGRRRRVAREHVPGDGDRRRDAQAEAVEHRRRPQRSGHQTDRRADGLRVPSEIRIPIIGMGGIASASDALEFIIAGASAVQVGTANFADPFIWPKLLEGFREYGERQA
jgi:dihydroorotate dehydrogenase (NAD+) catalytic subunit